MASRRVTYTSRIPEILDRVEREAPDVVRDTAQAVATTARATVPVYLIKGFLKRSIRVSGVGLERRVEAGRVRGHGFYAHMVEFGTSRTPAQPFLVPATEANRAAFRRRLQELYE